MRRSRSLIIAVATAVLAGACLVGAGVALAADASSNDPAGSAAPQSALAAVRPPVLEATFVPITPCRIIDTRAAGGRIAVNATRNFVARGTTGFAAQGGAAGGCGIPEGATALMVSVSPVNVGGVGYFRAGPYGQPIPSATLAHYEPGPITTTGGTVTLASSGAYDLAIRAFAAPASIVVDVTGYFAPQMAAFVALDGTLEYATPRVTASSHLSTGNYLVTFDTDVSRCSFVVTPYAYNYVVAVGPDYSSPTVAHVYIHEQTGTTTWHDTSFFIQAVC